MPLLQTLLDTFFPIHCLGCRTHGQWICNTCLAALPIRLDHRCPTCLIHPTPYGQTCFSCTKKNALDGLFVASYYQSPLLSRAIHTYKYRFIPGLAEPLGTFLCAAIRHFDIPLPDCLVPVPLHPRRLRFRGFNQSALLADTLSRTLLPELGLPVLSDVLVRTRFTKPQMKTESREERLANLQGAFTSTPHAKTSLTNQSIWLIDDVATTGTTLEECAKVLKHSGAKHVFGIVLAR